jgi:uncharacterized protein involved in copper resistance
MAARARRVESVATTATKSTLAVAGEIDAWCTKCKMDLNHRICALADGKVKRVLCLTCKTEHMYHKPKTAPAAAANGAAKAPRSTAKKTGTGRTTAAEREAAAAKAERIRVNTWERAIAGQPSNAFRQFRITESFNEGDLVRHTKFGDGVVARVVDRMKVEILFQDGAKTMAHGQSS